MIGDLIHLRHASHHRWIVEKCWPQSAEFESIIKLLNQLRAEQRKVIALISQNVRDSGMHDVLFYLSKKIIAGRLEISMDGAKLLPELFEEGMHYDWVSRC